MKKILVVLFAAMIVPAVLNAANIFIWDYDPADTFYCDDAGQVVNTRYWVEQTLTALGHSCIVDTALPASVNSYDAVFALCGWYSC